MRSVFRKDFNGAFGFHRQVFLEFQMYLSTSETLEPCLRSRSSTQDASLAPAAVEVVVAELAFAAGSSEVLSVEPEIDFNHSNLHELVKYWVALSNKMHT